MNCSAVIAMIIGFTERSQTVSEGMTDPGFDVFVLPIEVSTLRTAEREYPMNFRVQEAGSPAMVEPIGRMVDPLYDATFGSRDSIDGPIEVFFVLETLNDVIPPLTVFIKNDRRPEDDECFTIRLFPLDVAGRRELFSCNEDFSGEDNFFCQTEICIDDDDGEFAVFVCVSL